MSRKRAGRGSVVAMWVLDAALVAAWQWMLSRDGACSLAPADGCSACLRDIFAVGLAPMLGWLLLLYGVILVMPTVTYLWRLSITAAHCGAHRTQYRF